MNLVHCLICDSVYEEQDICPDCGNDDMQKTVFLQGE